jgi:hypothetical protein
MRKGGANNLLKNPSERGYNVVHDTCGHHSVVVEDSSLLGRYTLSICRQLSAF